MPVSRPLRGRCDAREPSRPDALGRPLNAHVRGCPACAATGFTAQGWCGECRGLGWYAVVRPIDIVATLAIGAGAGGLAILVLAL